MGLSGGRFINLSFKIKKFYIGYKGKNPKFNQFNLVKL